MVFWKNEVSFGNWNYCGHGPRVVVIVVHIGAVIPVLVNRSQDLEEIVPVVVRFPLWPWFREDSSMPLSNQMTCQMTRKAFESTVLFSSPKKASRSPITR